MKEVIKNFLRSLIELIDGGIQITERQLEMARMLGDTLTRMNATQKGLEGQCSHRKGGMVRLAGSRESIRRGLNSGTGSQYAVRKHQMMNGDIWVDCLRCGKKWRPPVVENFTRKNFFGFTVLDGAAYAAALDEYNTAVKFETNNYMSGSVQCRFTDRKTGLDATKQIRSMYAAMGE
jgi:hypothetical protein